MTPGQRITAIRKAKGITQEVLGEAVGLSKSAISKIENDDLSQGIDINNLIRIAKALEDITLLSAHCEACPIRGEIFIKKFPELNNIQTDPTAIAVKVQKELREGMEVLAPLIDRMDKKDFASCPDYQQVQEQALVQIIGTARALEILKEQLMVQQILTPEKLREMIQRQQEICEAHGHHKPEKASV